MTVRYTRLNTKDVSGTDSEEENVQIKHTGSRHDHVRKRSGSDGSETFTVEEAVEKLGIGWFQIRLWLITALLSAADACEMMLLAVISPVLRCEWGLTQTQVAFVTTVVFIGMGIMAPFWGYMGDRYGRRSTLLLLSFLIWYFGFLTAFSPSYTWVLILRGLVGAGMGGIPQRFTLLTEYSPKKHRSMILNFDAFNWAVGTVAEITMASIVIPTLGWRWLLAFSSVPCFVILILFQFLPPSARFLVGAGRTSEAMAILQKLSKANNTALPKGTLVQEISENRGHPKLLFTREYRRVTIQIWLLWCGTALTYYGMVLASAEILQLHNIKESGGEKCSCNLLKHDDYISMIVSTLGEFIALPLNVILMDLIGRKYTGAVNFIGGAIFFLLIQVHVSQGLLTFFIFMVRGFSTGMFSFVQVYTSEVYPTSIRAFGLGSSVAWSRIGAMVTPFLAQVLLDTSLTSAVWVYGTICLACAVCALMLPIETKGRALKEMVT